MKAIKILAAALLLLLGVVATFKCLGDVKRPLLGGGGAQHSLLVNAIAWMIGGLLPLLLAHRLLRRSGDPTQQPGEGRLFATCAIAAGLLGLAAHALLGPAATWASPSDLYYNVFVLMPLSVVAALASGISLVCALLALSVAARRGPLQLTGLLCAAVSVVVTCP